MKKYKRIKSLLKKREKYLDLLVHSNCWISNSKNIYRTIKIIRKFDEILNLTIATRNDELILNDILKSN